MQHGHGRQQAPLLLCTLPPGRWLGLGCLPHGAVVCCAPNWLAGVVGIAVVAVVVAGRAVVAAGRAVVVTIAGRRDGAVAAGTTWAAALGVRPPHTPRRSTIQLLLLLLLAAVVVQVGIVVKRLWCHHDALATTTTTVGAVVVVHLTVVHLAVVHLAMATAPVDRHRNPRALPDLPGFLTHGGGDAVAGRHTRQPPAATC